MKLLFWNARGLANLDSRLVLKNMVSSHVPEFLFIAEPWISLDQIPSDFWSKLNMKNFAVNTRPDRVSNLWCFCSEDLDPTVILTSSQQITFSVVWDDQTIYITSVYAATNYIRRRSLWQEMVNLNQRLDGPCCCIGDFNAVLGAQECRGSKLPSRIACNEFKTWSDACDLIHFPTRGA